MTKFTVHLFREMRLTYPGIEAASADAAAAIARSRTPDDAEAIEDCNGDDLAAIVDIEGDSSYERSVAFDFEAECTRKAAGSLLAALQGLLPYATGEARRLKRHSCSLEAEREAGRAWEAVGAAYTALAMATSADVTPFPSGFDAHAALAARLQIADIWGIDDVKSIRSDLTPSQCWQVLQAAGRYHDAEIGINWDVLRFHAESIFGEAPDTTGAGEEAA